MKYLMLVFAFCTFFLSNAMAQQTWDLSRPMLNPARQVDKPFEDAYPLLEGPVEPIESSHKNPFLLHESIDPGILLPPMNWDCDPGILFSPKLNNCDPGIIWPQNDFHVKNPVATFKRYMPPSLFRSPMVTPFLLPGASPLLKQQELREEGRLKMEELPRIDALK